MGSPHSQEVQADILLDDSHYWLVILGPLNHFNPRAEIPYPNRESAIRSAKGHAREQGRWTKVLDPDLTVRRRYDKTGKRVESWHEQLNH